MKKIGIYTAYDPKVDLHKEGLGRFQIFLLKGLVAAGYTPFIAIPSWHIESMKEFLRENNLEQNVKLFYVVSSPPVIFQVMDFFSTRLHVRIQTDFRMLFLRFYTMVRNLLSAWFYSMLVTNSWGLAILFALLFVLLIPLIAVGGAIWFLGYLMIAVCCKLLLLLKRWIVPENKLLQLKNIFMAVTNKDFRALRFFPLVQNVRQAYRRQELPSLIHKINASDIEKWIVPTVFWNESTGIIKPKVIVVPDLVYLSFPLHMCSLFGIRERIDGINSILGKESNFITYSRFVKEEQLMKYHGFSSSQIHVIPHAPMDMSDYVKPELLKNTFTSLRSGAYRHLARYEFTSFDYIIYPSQMRPYKNVMALVQACHKLIMKKYCNIKLVLTMNDHSSIANYIKDNNMTNNVIFASNLSNAQLAALYHSARLAVNPTLFEGGFPFTFSEAFSVGTPSVMSKIPVVEEYVSGDLAERMLFDPYNVDDMVRQIHWGLLHREELYQRQEGLYARLRARSWKDVAMEYAAAIR